MAGLELFLVLGVATCEQHRRDAARNNCNSSNSSNTSKAGSRVSKTPLNFRKVTSLTRWKPLKDDKRLDDEGDAAQQLQQRVSKAAGEEEKSGGGSKNLWEAYVDAGPGLDGRGWDDWVGDAFLIGRRLEGVLLPNTLDKSCRHVSLPQPQGSGMHALPLQVRGMDALTLTLTLPHALHGSVLVISQLASAAGKRHAPYLFRDLW
jgi:hypothetical protein